MKDAINDHDSIMEEAFNYVNIMTTEAGVTLSVYLKHLALTIHFRGPKTRKIIKLRFVKVWATPPSEKKQEGPGRNCSISGTFFHENKDEIVNCSESNLER